MALQVKALSFTAAPVSGSQTVTGVGFRGKSAIFMTVGSTTAQDGTIQTDQHISFGIVTGSGKSTQRYALIWSPTAQATSSCRKQLGDGVFGLMATSSTLSVAAQLSVWTDDGFVLTYPVSATVGQEVHVLVFGGPDFYKYRLQEGDIDGTVPDQDYPGYGFQPSFVLPFGVRGQNTSTLPATLNLDNGATFNMGAALSIVDRWAIALTGQNGQVSASSMGAVATQRNDMMMALLKTTSTSSAGLEKHADLDSFQADGPRLDLTEDAVSALRRFAMLAILGPQVAVGKINRSGGTITLSFVPKGVLFASFHQAATATIGGDSQISIGFSDGTNHKAVWTRLQNTPVPTVSHRVSKRTACFVTATTAPAVDTVGTVSFFGTTVTLASSPTGAIDDEITYIVWGDAVDGTIPANLNPVYSDMATAFNVPEMAKPAYLIPVAEPTFRDPDVATPTITRIADDPGRTFTIPKLPIGSGIFVNGIWGGRAQHGYSKRQPWNYDQTLFILEHNEQSDSHNATYVGTPTKIILDGQTMVPKYAFGPVASANLDEYRWHPSLAKANILVNVTSDGKKLQHINVLTDSIEQEWDLSLAIAAGVTGFGDGEGNLSDDGRWIALFRNVDATGITSNDADCFVVDMSLSGASALGAVLRVPSTDPISVFTNKVMTWLTMSASGNYVVAHWRGEKTSILSLNKTTRVLTIPNLGAFGSGLGGDAWNSANYACVTDGTTTVKSQASAVIFGSDTGMTGMKVTGGKVGGVLTTVYVTAVLAAPPSPASGTWITVSQALDANAAVTLRIGDEADKGHIWRMGHADQATNPYDGDADVVIGQDQRVPAGDLFNGRTISHVVMTKLSTGAPTSLTFTSQSSVSEMTSHHISTRNKRLPGWVYVSYFEKTSATDRLYQQEVIAVQLVADGASPSSTGRRFAHHHSDHSTLGGNPGTYQAEVHPCPSWDGHRIVFKSDWTRQCDSGCGINTYTGGYPAGVYQSYIITAIFEPQDSIGTEVLASMTRTLAKQYVARAIGGANSTAILALADDALAETANKWNIRHRWSWLQKDGTPISIVAGTGDYTLPTDFDEFYSARLAVLDRPLQYFEKRDYDRLYLDQAVQRDMIGITVFNSSGFSAASPVKKARIIGLPNSADSLEFTYYRTINPTADPIDVPGDLLYLFLADARAALIMTKNAADPRLPVLSSIVEERLKEAIGNDTEQTEDNDIAFQPPRGRPVSAEDLDLLEGN